MKLNSSNNKICFYNYIIPYKYDIKENYVAWIPFTYFTIFRDEIVPKFLDKFIAPNKQKQWKNHFDSLLPKRSLGYASEKAYLEANQLTRHIVVLNSLKYIFEKTIDADEFDILAESFLGLISTEKVRVLRKNNQAIYKEILDVCSYIKKIETVLEIFPLKKNEYRGTAHTTKFKSLIKTQINKLKDRLDHPYFPITSKSEIDNTKMTLKFLDMCLDKELKHTPEYFSFINATYGLNSKALGLNKKELKLLKVFLNFYNGIKTERIELIQSVAILVNESFKNLEIDKSKKAEFISDIIEIFFKDEIKKYNKSNSKRTFSYNAKSVTKKSRVKTVLHDTFIFAYDSSNGADIITEILTVGFNSMFGIKNIFEPDKPTEDEISNIQMIRSLLHMKNEFDISTSELRIMLHLSNSVPIILEYSTKRKKSSEIISNKSINHLTIPSVI